MTNFFKNRRLSFIKPWRIWLILILVFLLSGLLFFQFFMLQVIKGDFYKSLAAEQHQLIEKLTAKRGEIYMIEQDSENRFKVAVNTRSYVIYVDTRKILDEEKEEIITVLVDKLEIKREEIESKLNKEDDPFEIIKKGIDEETIKQLEEMNLSGVYWYPEEDRYYIENSLASQVLGFVGHDDNKKTGQYGIEQYYNDELQGVPGSIVSEGDTSGIWIATTERKVKDAEDGRDLVLTIDRAVQLMGEETLQKAVEDFGAEQGSVIIMDPNDGDIIAMANYPTYDLNNYNQVEDASLFLNSSIHQTYEPGSIFKPLTMSAALDSGAVLPDSTFYDNGFYQPSDFDTEIRNFGDKSYGNVTMTQILENSINTGTIHLVNTMGKETFADYVTKFGFNEKTEIDLMGEAKGDISSMKKLRGDVNFATASFGQGLTVTPLGITRAISAIANGGSLVRPHIISSMIDNNGNETKYNSSAGERILQEETARKVTSMLVSVVENGHSSPAKIEGYHIAAKTGTAQVANKDEKGYSETETIQSFVGYFPAFEPKFTILVKLDKPTKSLYATQSAAPVFKEIASFLINYYDIAPDY